MSDTPDKKRPSKRERGAIYGERRTVSLRLEPELHQRMMDHVTKLRKPANTWVIELIENALKKAKS